jgi:hypothetical protein
VRPNHGAASAGPPLIIAVETIAARASRRTARPAPQRLGRPPRLTIRLARRHQTTFDLVDTEMNPGSTVWTIDGRIASHNKLDIRLVAAADRFLKSNQPRAFFIRAANRKIPFLRSIDIIIAGNQPYVIRHCICPAQRTGTWSLDLKVLRRRLAAITDDFILDVLSFVERAKAGALYCRDVHEDVLSTTLRLNETVALRRIEPLYRSGRHLRNLQSLDTNTGEAARSRRQPQEQFGQFMASDCADLVLVGTTIPCSVRAEHPTNHDGADPRRARDLVPARAAASVLPPF